MIIRNATMKDLVYFYGEKPDVSSRSRVAEIDGVPVAIIGVSYYKLPTLFSLVHEPMKKHKKEIVKQMFSFMKEVIESGLDSVYAVASESEALSEKILTRLGFEFQYETSLGVIYKWHK